MRDRHLSMDEAIVILVTLQGYSVREALSLTPEDAERAAWDSVVLLTGDETQDDPGSFVINSLFEGAKSFKISNNIGAHTREQFGDWYLVFNTKLED